MNKDSMEISVVIPLYNKKDSILRAIDSVLAQTYLPKEIIVINDGSTDGSEKIVETLKHPLIRILNQDNVGVSAARNKGIELAKNEWIAFLDADDFWENEFIQEIRITKNKFPNSSAIFAKYQYFYDGLVQYPKIHLLDGYNNCDNYFEMAALGSPPIWTGAVVVKKSAIEKLDCFNQKLASGEDLIVWAKLAFFFEISYINKTLSNYTFPLSIATKQPFRSPDDNNIVSSELGKLVDLADSRRLKKAITKYIAKWHRMRMHVYAHQFNFRGAISEYKIILSLNPLNFKSHFIIPVYLFQYLTGINLVKDKFR